MTDDHSTGQAARTELHDGWGELVLNRPHPRNTLIGPMVTDLRDGLAVFTGGGARAVVLRGAHRRLPMPLHRTG